MRDLTEIGKQQAGWPGSLALRNSPSETLRAAVEADLIAAEAANGINPALARLREPSPWRRFLAYLGIAILDRRPRRVQKWYAADWSAAQERKRIIDGHPIPYWLLDSE